MIKIRNRFSGVVLQERETLSGADLSEARLFRADLGGANLSGANLSGANLSGANLSGANLSGADLYGADLYRADLRGALLSGALLSGALLSGANLSGADLYGANLSGADLYGADLSKAILPDGRVWEAYRSDHLAGICQTPEIRQRAIQAWGQHSWTDCPMHCALGISQASEAANPILVAAWVALYDARLLERPE